MQTLSHVQLCGFRDASERGYSTVVYLRLIISHNSVSISLLGIYTPTKQLSDFKLVLLAVHVSEPSEWIRRFSSYDRMLRVVTWMRRFIGRWRRKQYTHDFLQRPELQESLIYIVWSTQCKILHCMRSYHRSSSTSLNGRSTCSPSAIVSFIF